MALIVGSRQVSTRGYIIPIQAGSRETTFRRLHHPNLLTCGKAPKWVHP
jgi:hypothetical protein